MELVHHSSYRESGRDFISFSLWIIAFTTLSHTFFVYIHSLQSTFSTRRSLEVLTKLVAVCNHPNLVQPRSVTSPFHSMESIVFELCPTFHSLMDQDLAVVSFLIRFYFYTYNNATIMNFIILFRLLSCLRANRFFFFESIVFSF